MTVGRRYRFGSIGLVTDSSNTVVGDNDLAVVVGVTIKTISPLVMVVQWSETSIRWAVTKATILVAWASAAFVEATILTIHPPVGHYSAERWAARPIRRHSPEPLFWRFGHWTSTTSGSIGQATDVDSLLKMVSVASWISLNEVLTRELAEDGYSGVEVRVTPMRTEIIIRATRTQNVRGEKGRRIRELTSVVQKRFKFPENSVELYAEKVNNRGLCAIAQAESLRYKLLGGLAVRRACYGVLRFVMESGAKGCEVIVSGKLRAQRAKAMKFKDGYMISSGQPVNEYIDSAVRHVLLRQGAFGVKVKIMLDWDPKGKVGPITPLPDLVTIQSPKEEEGYNFTPALAASNIEIAAV
ncbi:hypothetical protein SO802_005007 [Lithocarpus litseifolius]|uniref:KH type-2 domain-containing protein n=1 Tax=Lithocarpus litseifolius TaxID=425828 RepID=A0AAW2DIA5_9ROSI